MRPWERFGHELICDTVTAEWLSDSVCLLRFMYPEPSDQPYRGVVNAHVIDDGMYEFKGMVFIGEAATLVEHRSVKGYFRNRGLKGISKRLKNGSVITKEYA